MKSGEYRPFGMAPYVRSRVTTADLMYLVVLSLLPCAGVGIYHYGFHAALLIGCAAATAIVCELACSLIWRKRQSSVMDYSCVVSGLICGLLLPPAAPLWLAAAMAALAIVVFKNLCGGLGHNLLNPAMAAKCVLLLVCRDRMLDVTSWNYTALPPLELLQSGETPELLDMLTGNVAGCIGTASALAVLVTAAILFLLGLIDLMIPAAAILAFSVGYVLIGRYGLSPYTLAVQLCGGSFLFTCFIMAQDYTTSPVSGAARIWYGILLGAGVFAFRQFGLYEDGTVYALLLVNLLRPLLDRRLAPKPFGYSAHKWVIRELRVRNRENGRKSAGKTADTGTASLGNPDLPPAAVQDLAAASRKEGKGEAIQQQSPERTMEEMDREFLRFQEIIEKEARGLETARYTGDDTLLRQAYAEAQAENEAGSGSSEPGRHDAEQT